jgi:general secretion pathway protein D
MELARLVDLAAERTGIKVEYDASIIRGSITLRVDEGLKPDSLWTLMQHVLSSRGFTTVKLPGSDTLSVVKLNEAAGLAEVNRASSAGSFTPGREGFISRVMRVRNRPPKEVAEPLKAMLSKPAGAVAPLGEEPFIVISDLAPRVEAAAILLEEIDRAADTAVEAMTVHNLGSAQLAAMVMQVAQKRDQTVGRKVSGEVIPGVAGDSVLIICPKEALEGWRSLITQLDQREGIETRTYAIHKFAPKEVATLIEKTVKEQGPIDERWRLVIDDLTASLIISATPAQHEQIAKQIERLESVEGSSSPVRVFPIRNRPVADVVAMLSKLIEAGVLNQNTGSRPPLVASPSSPFPAGTSPLLGNSPATPPTTSVAVVSPASKSTTNTRFGSDGGTSGGGSPRRPSENTLNLTADEATNTLIAVGEPRLLGQIEALLKTLDVRQPQVMLEVMLVSLTESQAMSLGMELERIGSLGNATTRLASLFGLSTSSAAGRVVGDAAGGTAAILNPGEFSVILRALETLNSGRSVSLPKLLITNNEQATFSSTLQQPVQTTNVIGGSQTVTAFGGTDEAGTTITVKPQIAQGDHVLLQYSISLSSFVGSSSAPGLPPPKQQNKVDSTAAIPDDHVIMVGGLDLVSDGKGTNQVPFLGDIPILGEAFKSRNNSATRTRFFVFIRTCILRREGF